MKKHPALTAHDRRRVAVEARCGERAVRRFYDGGRIRELTFTRIVEALTRLGLPNPYAAKP